MSVEELATYFHEIFHIWKKKTEVLIIECDVSIKRVYEYKGEMPKFVLGRGGTDFDAPIRYNNDVFKGDALIYFTDGQADMPKTKSKVPIFWLIYGENSGADKLPGRVVQMN